MKQTEFTIKIVIDDTTYIQTRAQFFRFCALFDLMLGVHKLPVSHWELLEVKDIKQPRPQ